MQPLVLQLARVFCFANFAGALTSPWVAELSGMPGDSTAMSDDGVVSFHFEPMDPEDIFDGPSQRLAGPSFTSGFGGMERSSHPGDIIMLGPEQLPTARASIPASTVRNLFPGPAFVFDEADGPPMPFATPDRAVLDMLEQMDSSFTRNLLPIAHRAAGAGHTDDSCGPEIREYCREAHSPLKCLGQNNVKISDQCREDIGKSVPFVCSDEMDTWCPIWHLEKGILDCLAKHLKELKEDCRDAVSATHHVISRAKSQKASVTDPVTGAQKVNVPKQKETPQQRDNLDGLVDRWIDGSWRFGSSAAIELPTQNLTQESPGTSESPEAHDVDEILKRVVDRMVPKISASAEKEAESKWRDKYMQLEAENEKLKAALQGHSVSDAANVTTIHKADVQASDRINAPKSDKAAAVKELLPSNWATLVLLLLTAFVSLLMLRSERITKLFTKHGEKAPLVEFRPPGVAEHLKKSYRISDSDLNSMKSSGA